MFLVLFCGCRNQHLEGEYFVDNSNVKLTFRGNSLLVEENSIPIYTANLLEKTKKSQIYFINQIYISGVIDKYRKTELEIGKKIYLIANDKTSIMNDENINPTSILEANFFAEGFSTYKLNKKLVQYSYFKNKYLKEVEAIYFESLNFPLLLDKYSLITENKFDEQIYKEIKKLFDNNAETESILPIEIISKLGLEFLIKSKNDDNQKKGLVINAIKICIPSENFYNYSRPLSLKIHYATFGKDNPGYKSKLYEYETEIKLLDVPGKQVFYFLEPIINCNYISISVGKFYEGLMEKVAISDITFYME